MGIGNVLQELTNLSGDRGWLVEEAVSRNPDVWSMKMYILDYLRLNHPKEYDERVSSE